MKQYHLLTLIALTLLFSLVLPGATPLQAQETPQPLPSLRDMRDRTGAFAASQATRAIDVGIVAAHTDGSTQTHALLAGSNAINLDQDIQGEVITACEYLAQTLTELNKSMTDQRGISRPQWGVCDLGAFEVEVVNLLANGGFETAGATAKTAVSWTVTNPKLSDKRLCTAPASEGACVFQFNTGVVPTLARSLKQTLTTGDLGSAGQTLTLSAKVAGYKFKTGGKIIVTVTYADDTTAKTVVAIPNGTYDFTDLTKSLNLTQTVQKIVVTINVAKVTGRVRLDDVRLTLSDTTLLASPTDTRDGTGEASPAAPDGFRK